MEKIKRYLIHNFEQFFILLILLTVVLINYFLPYKIAFLNFYFLPVILAAYYLGVQRSLLGAIFCILLVSIYSIVFPQYFILPFSSLDLYLQLVIWGGFLILTGIIVGTLQTKIKEKAEQAMTMNERLLNQQEALNQANLALKDYNETLEIKVKERTEQLEKSKQAVEAIKAKVEDTLYTTMDASVAKLIIEGRLRNEKRDVSVLFADIAGFTSYSESLSPEVVVRDLNRFLKEMEPIILKFHGHIDKFLGDGFMCEFGAPLDYHQYRLLAVSAALILQKKMELLNYPWQMRIGIASGNTITGIIGSRKQSYTAIGDVVNLASRLESSAPVGSILIDGNTYAGIEPFITCKAKIDFSLCKENKINNVDEQFEKLQHILGEAATPMEKARCLSQLADLYKASDNSVEALAHYERALRFAPDDNAIKLAFAEMAISVKAQNKITVKGRKAPVTVFEVTGFKDVLLDRNKFSQRFYQKYASVAEKITIPEEVILPVEALDGSIGHSRAVAVIAYAIASELNLAEDEINEILHAGFVADIGKETVPHHLLNLRESSLSEMERHEIQRHAIEGPRVLKNMGYTSSRLLEIVKHSHENYNGSGYPDGLSGDTIPIGSRIVAVADAFDALTSLRPYRERWDRNAAFSELQLRVEEGVFDAQIVEHLIQLNGDP